mgnify:CR=1 FL=1
MSSDPGVSAGVRAWRLDGSRALVTGGSSGIGLSTARELAALGAEVVLAARDADKLERATREIAGEVPGACVEAVAADLATPEGRERACAADGSELQVLVNNAGTNIRKRMADLTFEEFRQVQRANLESCFEMCRLLHPALAAGAPSSVAPVRPRPATGIRTCCRPSARIPDRTAPLRPIVRRATSAALCKTRGSLWTAPKALAASAT